MFDIYILNYNLGEHHLTVDVSEYDFHRICDDLKKEFKLYNSYEVIATEPVAYESIYYIVNYHGFLEKIGRRYWNNPDSQPDNYLPLNISCYQKEYGE